MGIRGIENLANADQGYVLHVTKTNHDWVSQMSGLSVEEVGVLYDRAVERGVVCTLNVTEKPNMVDVSGGTVARYEAHCRACGEVFESEDGYGAAREQMRAHEEADHLQ